MRKLAIIAGLLSAFTLGLESEQFILNKVFDVNTSALKVGSATGAPLVTGSGTTDEIAVWSDSSTLAASGVTIDAADKFVRTFTSDAPYDPASLAGGASRQDSVAVTGLVAGRALVCNPGTDINLGNCLYNCFTDFEGIAKIHWYNGDDGVGGTSCNPTSSTWVFMQPSS